MRKLSKHSGIGCWLLLMLLGAVQPMQAVDVLLSDDFETATNPPEGWSTWNDGGKPVVLAIDRQQPRQGKQSLRVDAASTATGNSNATRPIPHAAGRTIRVQAWIKGRKLGTGATDARLVVLPLDDAYKSMEWLPLGSANSGLSDHWKAIDEQVTVPASAQLTLLEVHLGGPVQMWIDQIRVTVVETGSGKDRKDDEDGQVVDRGSGNLIRNGDMELGERLPDGWNYGSTADQRWIRAELDRRQPAEGKTSLRLTSLKSSAPRGGVIHLLGAGYAGKRLTITFQARGKIDAGKTLSASFGAVSQDAEYKDTWLGMASDQQMLGREWKTFTKSITIPDDSTNLLLVLEVLGQGSVWLDGVTVVSAP